ncbi:unnamed protein product [Rangifer tarandus platyrhynchus]|uniref:Uncharacterized protein n=1 Tax=Rangifer tarandus platyrhynchus TaxID=3082113 RepID=A0AC60A4F8_RANTA
MGGEKGPEKQSGEIGHSPTRANGTEAGTLGPDARCSRAQPLGPRQSDHSCFMCNARRSEDASCLSGGAVFTTRNTRVIPSVTRAGRRSLHKLQEGQAILRARMEILQPQGYAELMTLQGLQ